MNEMTPTTTRVIRLLPDGPPGSGLQPLALDPADFQSPLPEQSSYVAFADPALGMNVGVWETTTMQEAFGPYPGDEFILVIEGEFAMLDGEDRPMPAHQGQSVIFRNGAPMSWKQEGYLKKYFLTLLDPDAPQPELPTAEGGIMVLDPDAELGPEAEVTTTETGVTHRERVIWTNDAGTMEVGIWETGPWQSDSFAFGYHEFAQILAGEVTITHADGTAETFGPGDVFFIPAGTVTQWSVSSRLRKYYAAVTPKG